MVIFMPKVLVLMSTYNGENFLHEQLDSILAQKDVSLEILVRDDGSTDTTHVILDEYKDKGLLTWYSGKNLGPGRSFFDLCQNATESEYYAFADQDDYWMPDKLVSAVQRLEVLNNDTKPAMYCSSFIATDEKLKPLKTQNNHAYGRITLGHAMMENIAPGCTCVFNLMAIKALRRFNMDSVDIHDWVLFRIVVALGGNVIYDSMPHILYRQHKNNNIGSDPHSIKTSLIRRWQNKKMYSNCAKVLVTIYKMELQSPNFELLHKIAEYDRNSKYKFSLLFSRELFVSHVIGNIFLRFLLILNWL